jgi:hypothetical protein
MSARDDGGSAFPSHGSMGEVAQEGMTLRDYFAAKAMQGFLSQAYAGPKDWTGMCRGAFKVADAMLEARAAS